jgi:hypothetical protein
VARSISLFLSLGALIGLAMAAAALQDSEPLLQTLVLYDASLGTTLDEQGFSFLAFGVSADRRYEGDATVLDSTGDMGDQAGYFSSQSLALDRESGYRIQINMTIEAEEHANRNRAGFSLLVLGDDLLGLELAFWEDRIWVQEGGAGDGLFTHAEEVLFDTTASQTAYELAITGDTYTLYTAGQELLTGPLRDYTAFEGFPDPYESPGLIFIGDNTTRAAARTAVAYVAVETALPATDTPAPSSSATMTATARPTAAATATARPTAAPPPATPTPRPSKRLYLWQSCLKGVDLDVQK